MKDNAHVPAETRGRGGPPTRDRRRRTAILGVLTLILAVCAQFGAAPAQAATFNPTVTSDFADYNPGQTVTLTGTGWDPAGSAVTVATNDSVGNTWQRSQPVTAAPDGSITDVFSLPTYFVASYSVTATQTAADGSTLTASTTFTDANASADLDQCANDSAPSPNTDGCNSDANQWVNGNLGASKAFYLEGDTIPYRMKFDSLSLASHTVTVEWDTTKSGTHALDYITSYNKSVANANPCLGIAGCSGSPSSTFNIPADPQVTGAGVTPLAGVFSMWGANITSVSTYSYANGTGFAGDKSARISITFTATQANPVLAWGGHISARKDWGQNNSAVAISGSPYHTRLIALDGSGGNQDRSLSADAVIFPGSITVIKQATPEGSQSFGFSASPAPLANFSLVDDGTSANTRTFPNIVTFGTYTVTENAQSAPWIFDSASCGVTSPNGGSTTVTNATASINLAEGENVTCTYLNHRVPNGTLTVIKHVINDNGGTAVAGNWNLHVKNGSTDITGSPAAGKESPGTTYTVDPGTYTLSETDGPSGYQPSSWTCTGTGTFTAPDKIAVNFGQSAVCTINNNDIAPKLHLRKVVINDNGGTKTVADFPLSAAGTKSGNSLSGVSPVDSTSSLQADTWDLSETTVAGYTASAWSCSGGAQNGSKITVGVGGEATCTITNDDQTAHLTLVKHVANNHGGTAVATDFTLSAAGPTPIGGAGGADQDVNAGTYTLSETTLAGYAAGSWTCTGGSFDGTNKIALLLGQSATCEITNSDKTAHLTLVKHVSNTHGGTAVAANFTLSAAGPTPGVSGAGGADKDVDAGTYTLSETSLPGYVAGSWSCTGGTFTAPNKIALALNQSATCEITNSDQTAHLTLIKHVTNDNGGSAKATDFTLSAAGPTPIGGAGGADQDVNAGSYTLSETNLPGYTASSWTCTGGTFTAPNKIALALNQSATCEITNDDQTAHLKLVKHVSNNHGGTAAPTDFLLTATGPTGINGLGGTESDVNAGTYTLTESALAGYAAGSWSCTGGTFDGTDQVTLVLGQSATCEITNSDQTAHLTLIKHVTNDNGGSAKATDFTLSAAGPTPGVSGAGGADKDVDAGSYTLSETTLPGYTAGTWSCTGGTFTAPDKIALALNQSATCEITNDDQTAHLTLVKHVSNTHGGTAKATDFTLSAAGPTPIGGAGGASQDVNTGTYTLSETTLAGYTAGSWSCTGGTFTAPDQVVLLLGQSATCEITNSDQTAHLKLVKNVTNDNGGSAKATDFLLSAAGPTGINGMGGTESDVNAGTYLLSESQVAGYLAGSWSCVGGTFTAPNQIVLALGQSATCQITNDDQTAHLTLVKNVSNTHGGTAKPTDFTLSAAGPTPGVSGAGGADKDVDAGSYTLSETALAGYSAGTWSCVGGTFTAPNKIVLDLNQSATCQITNSDQTAHLTLVKHVSNTHGGTAVPANFTLSAAGPTPISGAGGADKDVNTGTYTLSETTLAGYTAGSWSCTGGTFTAPNQVALALGESATCDITNSDQTAHLTLVKHVVNNNGGSAKATDFTLSAAGPTPIGGAGGADQDVNAGSYTLTETNLPGYAASSWTCTGGTFTGPNTIKLALGQSATCDITNDDIAPKLHLRKVVVNDNDGTRTVLDFPLTAAGAGTNILTGTSPVDSGSTLKADTFALSEVTQSDYTASSWVCQGGQQNGANITLGLAQEATCTITNNDIPPKLHLRKVVINDNGGTKTVADFPLSAAGTKSGNSLSGVSPVDSGGSLKADTWTLSETSQYGYSASAWVCDGGSLNGNKITVAVGQEATCTITNDDKPGTIIVKKVTKPANTGSFAFTTTGSGYNGFTIPGGGQNSQTLNAGSYTVKESTQLGWILTGIGGSSDPTTPFNCTVTGSGGSTGVGDLDSLTASISLKNGDTVTCVFENTSSGVTRTQGFWATHSKLSNIAWFGGTEFGHTFPGVTGTVGIADKTLCGRPIDTLGKLMGAFWSGVSTTSTGAKRSALDQARMQLLQQLLAAELNASAFGSVPAGGTTMFAQWEAAYCGTNTNAIKNAQQQAASFNSIGDSSSFTPGTSADSKNARAVSTYTFWDLLP